MKNQEGVCMFLKLRGLLIKGIFLASITEIEYIRGYTSDEDERHDWDDSEEIKLLGSVIKFKNNEECIVVADTPNEIYAKLVRLRFPNETNVINIT